MTARGSELDRVRTLELGADDYVVKPFSMEELVARVRAARRSFGCCTCSRASAGRVVTRDELLQTLWGRRHSYRDRTVDVFVRKLRLKIDRRAPHHDFIHTRYGVGYRFEPIPK